MSASIEAAVTLTMTIMPIKIEKKKDDFAHWDYPVWFVYAPMLQSQVAGITNPITVWL